MGTSSDYFTCCICNNNFHCSESYLDCSKCNNIYCYDCSDDCENHMTKKQIKSINESLTSDHTSISCCEKCCVKPSHLGQFYTSDNLWVLEYYLQSEAENKYFVFDKKSEAEKYKKQIHKEFSDMLDYEDITINKLEIRRYC